MLIVQTIGIITKGSVKLIFFQDTKSNQLGLNAHRKHTLDLRINSEKRLR